MSVPLQCPTQGYTQARVRTHIFRYTQVWKILCIPFHSLPVCKNSFVQVRTTYAHRKYQLLMFCSPSRAHFGNLARRQVSTQTKTMVRKKTSEISAGDQSKLWLIFFRVVFRRKNNIGYIPPHLLQEG